MRIRRVLLLLLFYNTTFAGALDYQLTPIKVSDDIYMFKGLKQDFTPSNGGNIVNTGFIVTSQGVVVIDTGPSYLYGKQMRAAIGKVTDKPIIKVLITHHHPDHFLGSQAFSDVPIYALSSTIKAIEMEIASLLTNMYRLAGEWMRGTEETPELFQALNLSEEKLGNHQLQYLSVSGHTNSDLMVYVKEQKVLFSGDVVFYNRALTTPHALPTEWLATLDMIQAMDVDFIVPGHGDISKREVAVIQTADYLNWLEHIISNAVRDGLDMNEALNIQIPERFHGLAVLNAEFSRSVSHLYPAYEEIFFK